MYRLFKTKNSGSAPAVKRAATAVQKVIYQLKMKIAAALAKWESRLTIKEKKVYLLCFCILMVSLSSYWLYEGIFLKPRKGPTYLKQETISRPQDISLPDSLDMHYLEARKRQREVHKTIPDTTKN